MKPKKKILLVNNEFMAMNLLRIILHEEGYEVLWATNGEAAIKNIENERVALILLDLKLPGIDSIETLRKIRRIDKNMPVILTSDDLTHEDTGKIAKLGVFDYIQKPFRFKLDEVKLKVKKALSTKRDN